MQLIPLLLSQAANEDEYILSRLRSAIFDDGIFAVNDFCLHEGDGGLAFAGSLHAYATCAQAGHMEGHLNKVSLSTTTTIRIPGHAEAIDQPYVPWITGDINPRPYHAGMGPLTPRITRSYSQATYCATLYINCLMHALNFHSCLKFYKI